MKKSFALATLLIAVAAGCAHKADTGAPCSAVTAQFMKLALADVADPKLLTDDTARRVRDQLPALRDSLDLHCKDDKWERTVRDCLAIAPDPTAFSTCEAQLTDAQKAALERSTRGEEP